MASDDLRARLVAAFRAAAFDCPGDCGQTESECVEQHPIQVEVLHFDEIAVIGGPVEALADVAVTIIRDIAVPLRDELARLQSELAKAHTALQAVREAQSLGEALAAVAKHDGITTEPFSPDGLRGLLEHVGVDVAGRVITVDGVPIDDVASKPKPAHSCGNCDGIDPDTCPFNPTRTKENPS